MPFTRRYQANGPSEPNQTNGLPKARWGLKVGSCFERRERRLLLRGGYTQKGVPRAKVLVSGSGVGIGILAHLIEEPDIMIDAQ